MVLPILAVTDITASLDFYLNKLGWNKLFGMPGDDGKDMFAMIAMNEGVQFGLSAMDAPAPKGYGVVLMVYVTSEDDIDAYYATCQSNGVNITEEIKDEYWGDRCFMVTDPDGYCLNICKELRKVPAEEVIAASKA